MLVGIPAVSGPLGLAAFKCLKGAGVVSALGIEKKTEIATVIIGVSFGMLGILAAMIAVSFSLSGRSRFKSYRESGHLSVLLANYLFAVLSILLTALAAFFVFTKAYHLVAFDYMVMFFISSIFQSLCVSLGIILTSISFTSSS